MLIEIIIREIMVNILNLESHILFVREYIIFIK